MQLSIDFCRAFVPLVRVRRLFAFQASVPEKRAELALAPAEAFGPLEGNWVVAEPVLRDEISGELPCLGRHACPVLTFRLSVDAADVAQHRQTGQNFVYFDGKSAKTQHNARAELPCREEYQFIHAELLQYLNNYQAVRNMMYVVTLACLGLSIGNDAQNPHLCLLPLIVILPSFLVAVNFWKCVLIDSTYLKIFHEDRGSPFRWEGRHDQLFQQMPKLDDAINVQYLPYAVCAAVSLLLYVIHLSQSGETTQTDYILGAILFAACVLLFALHWKQDKQAIEDNWRKVLKSEARSSPRQVHYAIKSKHRKAK